MKVVQNMKCLELQGDTQTMTVNYDGSAQSCALVEGRLGLLHASAYAAMLEHVPRRTHWLRRN